MEKNCFLQFWVVPRCLQPYAQSEKTGADVGQFPAHMYRLDFYYTLAYHC